MAYCTRIAHLHDRLPRLQSEGRAGSGRVPSQALRRIKVVERPGADYPPPEHVVVALSGDDCWCDPELIGDEANSTLTIRHRRFEN